tara:strand:+ start:1163 stop:1336 length:174 start_codon:yes stop_codon:yes gene_type:complete
MEKNQIALLRAVSPIRKTLSMDQITGSNSVETGLLNSEREGDANKKAQPRWLANSTI